MSSSAPSTVIGARVSLHQAEELRQLAATRDTTVSKIVARAVADKLKAIQQASAK
jgi:hypothetical protein